MSTSKVPVPAPGRSESEPTRVALYRPQAALDIESIVIYLSETLDSPHAAQAWYEKFTEAVKLLQILPELGRPFCDERLALQERRTYLVDDYRLFYSVDSGSIVIWRVLHTLRDIDERSLVDFS